MPKRDYRILSNLPLPALPGYLCRTFYSCAPPGAHVKPETDLRPLREMLSFVPPDETPDILLIRSPEYLPIPGDVGEFPGLKVLFITDWNACLRFLPELCPFFDFCFTDLGGVQALRRAGVGNIFHQPLFGHDPQVYRDLRRPRDLDISFCGNLNPNFHRERNRLLYRLQKLSGKYRLFIRQVFGTDYVEVLNRSQLVFNFAVRGEANLRLFESMACGAVPLVEAGNLEVPLLFEKERHYLEYAPGALEAVIDGALARPAKLEAMREAGQRAVALHTQARQIRAALDFACSAWKKTPGRANLPAAAVPAGICRHRNAGSTALRQGVLYRMLVLGQRHMTLAQELALLHRHADRESLELEVLPALLLHGLKRALETHRAAPVFRDMLERLLARPGWPEPWRHLFRARYFLLLGRAAAVLEAAREGLVSLEAGIDPSAWKFVCFPPRLGDPLNLDLNRAFQMDARTSGREALRLLIAGHFHMLSCEAHRLRGETEKALVAVEKAKDRAAAAKWISLDCRPLELSLLLELKRRDAAAALLDGWLREGTYDKGAWERILQGYVALDLPDRAARALAEILCVGGPFITGEERAYLLSRYGGHTWNEDPAPRQADAPAF